MQAGVNPLNSKIFFKKLRKPLDDRFLLFRAVAAAKAGDGRQDLVNIRAGRFERAVAERIGNKALRFCGLQLFFRDDLFQLLLFLLLHIALPVAVNVRCGVDRTNKAVDQVLFAAQLDAGIDRPVDGSEDAFVLAVRFVVLHNQHQDSVCLAKNVFVKSTRSAMTLLFPSAQKEVNSKLLLVFLVLFRPSPCSLMWLLRVVLE